jgi:hypothetical protein
MAANSLFLGDIHTVPVRRRLVDRLDDPRAHDFLIALLSAGDLCRGDAWADS